MKKRNIRAVLIFPVLLLISICVLSTLYPVMVNAADGLGFTNGGGWFYWPETTDKTNFNFTVKYNVVNEKVQGNLLIIRHLENGGVYRLKSNALLGFSIGEHIDPDFGWASFSGEATFSHDPTENYQFLVYVEDWSDPGAGFDQFWIEVMDGDGNIVETLSMDRDAIDNTETLGGGNIGIHN